MYTRDIIRIPTEISRTQFIEEIFELGLLYQFGYDVLIESVKLGDKYVNLKGKYYSIELVHATLVLITKLGYDHYHSTDSALDATENKYVVVLEWEIFNMINGCIKIDNFITFVGSLWEGILPSVFWDLSKDICLNQYLLSVDPYVILCACTLLCKHNKLKAIKENKQRLFREIIHRIAREYEIEVDDILKQYIILNS